MTSILEIEVSSADTPDNYRVQIISSPAGEASATFTLEPTGLIDRLGDFQQTLLASSVPSRRLLSRGEASVRGIGQQLFEALFSEPSVAGVYRASSAVAAERGDTLRMVLRLNAPEIAVLPWESMFDQAAGSYVCRREPLVRYIHVASPPAPLKVQLPLRILALVASPRGLAPLDVEKEKEDLAQALKQPIERGWVVLHWIEHTTWAALQDALLDGSWHVIHFIGHGDFDIERDEGVLAFESESGRTHRVGAENFVDLLRESQTMPRLVVLNACESSASGSTDMFAGTAATLVRGGVSSVTAMQFEISDIAAIAFCRGFYSAIARGRGVDDAVRSGRVSILGLGEGSLEWITPTLYLRGRETQLFTVSRSPGPVASVPVHEELRADALAASESGDVASAVPLYDNILAENPNDNEIRRHRTVANAGPTEPAAVLPEAGINKRPDPAGELAGDPSKDGISCTRATNDLNQEPGPEVTRTAEQGEPAGARATYQRAINSGHADEAHNAMVNLQPQEGQAKPRFGHPIWFWVLLTFAAGGIGVAMNGKSQNPSANIAVTVIALAIAAYVNPWWRPRRMPWRRRP